MRAAGCLILLVVGAAAAATAQSICARDECSCQGRADGLQDVTCDCGGGAEPLLVGDRSQAHVPDDTGTLRVRRCGRVTLVSEALSGASRLSELELSDIGRLELQPNCLYSDRAETVSRSISVINVDDLQLDPQAFSRVKRLQVLEFYEVKGELKLDGFPDDAQVGWFRLEDSWMENSPSVIFKASMSTSIRISNCTFGSLDVRVGHVRVARIIDNTFHSLHGMHFNSSKGPEMSEAEVLIARNNISSLGVGQLKMMVHNLTVINNTFGTWAAPLRATYHTVDFTGNDFSKLGGNVFRDLEPVTDGNSNQHSPTDPEQKNLFTFSRNTLRGSYMTGGLYASFLTPTSAKSRRMVLYRVSDNRFTCDCTELQRLVESGEKMLNDTDLVQPTEDGLYESSAVHGQLYRNSTCLEDGRTLRQYRQDAYTADFKCVPSGAAAVAGTLMMTLLAAVSGLMAV